MSIPLRHPLLRGARPNNAARGKFLASTVSLDADARPDRHARHHEMEFPLRTHALLALGPLALVIAMAEALGPAHARVRGSRLSRARRRPSIRPPIEQADRPTSSRPGGRERVEQRLYEITIPALAIETEFPAVRGRLLADFPRLVEVLATGTPGTVLIAYRGEDEVDAWCEALCDAVATRRRSHGAPLELTTRARRRPVEGEASKRGPRTPRADRRACPRLVRGREEPRTTIRRRDAL
jgi:hypothetical protein